MILDNRTRYASADLERIILGALKEFGVTRHARDRVVVKPGDYSGWCWFPNVRKLAGRARMTLRVPTDTLDVRHFVWLVRHEVAHWAGIDHKQMHTSLMYWSPNERRKRIGPVGSERDVPTWAEGMTVATVAEVVPIAKPSRPSRDADAVRARRAEHARAMLAKSERKAKLAATLVKRWRRRVLAADNAIARAKSKRSAA